MSPKNTIKLRIPGKKLEAENELDWSQTQITVKNVRAYELGATTRGEAKERPIEETHAGDVVEVELENGLRFWTTPERLRDEVFAEFGVKRGVTDEVFDIPTSLPQRSGDRGIGGVIIKALRFFGVDIPKLGAKEIALKIENNGLKDGKGTKLYRCSSNEAGLELTPVAASDIPTDKRTLLLLHGTGSSTQGSFGELWSDAGDNWNRRESWLALLTKYDTVLALEHRTLTENPIKNVTTLLESLPDGLTLHVMSHSRGGMVGELLCRGSTDNQPPFSETEIEYFRKNDPKGLRGDLVKLNTLLQRKNIQVERFVRTACPARGTTLASGRLDIYFSVLRALLKLIPGIGGVAEGFAELAACVAGQRTDPSVLPGIEAMIPESPLVKLLNTSSAQINGRLRVISGDIQGGTLASTFMVLLTDPLYQSDHDLVVNTDSMFSGAQRKDGAAYVFYRGPEISHFNYFTNQPSVKKLEAALSTETTDDGFTPYDVSKEVSPAPSRGIREGRPRAAVFLLPGIMGSHLEFRTDRIWMDLSDLAMGGMAKLKLGVGAYDIRAEALIGSAYNPMIEHLSNSYDVETFPYDWRLSVTEAASKLAEAITQKLDALEPLNLPISIVAHSMGGVVTRAMMANHPDTWQRLCKHKEAKVIMLGTPNGGSHAIGMVLTGRDGLIRRLAMLDFKHDLKELLDIIRAYPGVAEMLPYELLESAAWPDCPDEEIKYVPPAKETLKNAKAVWNQIKSDTARLDPDRFFYIAGQAPATPNGMRVEGGRLVFDATPQGDGRVPWATGIPKGIRTWYADAMHGDLCKAAKCPPAVLDILRYGNTDRLPSVAPGNRGLPEKFDMPVERAMLHPDQEEFLAAALCAKPEKLTAKATRKIKLKVVHGSLEFASYPILVGHYCADTLVGAEGALDRHLGGRLLANRRLGLYPGEINTAQYFPNDGLKPKGAIIVGLGEVGALTPGALEAAISRGIRTYATSQADGTEKAATEHTGVSILLVGTNCAGLSVSTAIAAILRGIDKALQRLEKHGMGNSLALEEVELVELYEDIAIHASHALRDARKDADLMRRFDFQSKAHIDRKRGAMRRASSEADPDWWRRLGIEEDERGQLTFKLLTDRAREETYLQPSQRRLVDQFIEDALADSSPTNAAATTLFHMLIPNNLKQYAPDQRNLMLVLNKAAARYPWELMSAPSSIDRDAHVIPISVRAGMVRQLQLKTFREKVTHSSGKRVLVVGNPQIGLPRLFPDLPGAEKEAKEVVSKLSSSGYSPVSVVNASAKEILTALHAHEYRILHLSGHGVYDYEVIESADPCRNKNTKRVSGMVIGDNLFVTPAEIRQMGVVPELAFINCCNLGGISDRKIPNMPGLAANLGAELIGMGVRAVVAAGWAVNDEGAKLFASAFYDAMLSGKNFGYAVQQARAIVFNNNPNDNTWGAYQCYGDPSFTLGEGDNSFKPARDYSFMLPSEAVIELNNITAEACTVHESRASALQKRVQAVQDALQREWLDQGELLSALGLAWGELGQYDKAVEYLNQSLCSENGEASLKAIDNLCNFRARLAVETFDRGEAELAMQQLALAENEITKAIDICATSERWAVKGSVIKRRALILAKKIAKRANAQTKNELAAALKGVDACYEQANHLFKAKYQRDYAYPLLSSSAAKILLPLIKNKSAPDINALTRNLVSATNISQSEDLKKPCIWNVTAHAEAKLLQGIVNNTLPAQIEAIVKIYLDAKSRDGSPREWRSVKEHLDFMMTVAQAAGSPLAALIGEIRNRLD